MQTHDPNNNGLPPDHKSPLPGHARCAGHTLLDALDLQPDDIIALLWALQRLVLRDQSSCCRPGS
jgi:hypothetical protein